MIIENDKNKNDSNKERETERMQVKNKHIQFFCNGLINGPGV